MICISHLGLSLNYNPYTHHNIVHVGLSGGLVAIDREEILESNVCCIGRMAGKGQASFARSVVSVKLRLKSAKRGFQSITLFCNIQLCMCNIVYASPEMCAACF